ncbi:hypothetical protein [Bradyrhizobium sp. Leo170]|uniref:hypothetical protein n=1 Tax=Bradyrhizobium sp. Leo170 TaxID=1571199 RepID=UPI00102E6776|nr:hypothetical protein [Bradyrhizobium sp. Leo170]TAI59990.1 hypothetical protein CWO89_43185 [Bradyrhizobium sp. Leo170]
MTNANRKLVRVPSTLVARGFAFGKALVAHYAAGGSPQSRARSGNRGTESNPVILGRSKVGEVAAAIHCGLDPDAAVKWSVDSPDPGHDLVLNGARIDVKTTLPPFKLIWSNTINDLYEQKQFDVIAAVSISERDWSCCWVEGWITKGRFYRQKRIADGNHGLERGTWWLPKSELSNIDELAFLPVFREQRWRSVA